MSEERSKISLRSGGKRKGRPSIKISGPILQEDAGSRGPQGPQGPQGRSIAEQAPPPRPRPPPQSSAKVSRILFHPVSLAGVNSISPVIDLRSSQTTVFNPLQPSRLRPECQPNALAAQPRTVCAGPSTRSSGTAVKRRTERKWWWGRGRRWTPGGC
jgi:hypothetical protein